MNERPPRICLHPGCGALTDGSGRCAAHQTDRLRKDEPGRKLYQTAAWGRLRIWTLHRHPMCQCKDAECPKHGREECRAAAKSVHHKKDHNGDPALFFDESNLEALCASCHNRVTALRGTSS